MKISVVIATTNETDNLKDCLESLSGLSDEIIIYNLGKPDKRLDKLVHKHRAKIIRREAVKYIELIRNKMVKEASGDWILILDPDERLTNDLKLKLRQISDDGNYNAVNIPRKNVIFGKWIRHTNWWPDKQIRFFKKGKARWSTKIHSYPEVEGKIYELPVEEKYALVHNPYANVTDFIERQNRYSDIEAINLFEEGKRSNVFNLIYWPTREFLARYIKHQGFKDGFYGLSLTYMMMVYRVMVWVKLWEKVRNK